MILCEALPLVGFSFGVARVEIVAVVVVDLLALGFGRGRVEGGIVLVVGFKLELGGELENTW